MCDHGIPSREEIEFLKKFYAEGTRIRLKEMRGEPQMPTGLKGTVIRVDDIGQIVMLWDNKSTLSLNVREDTFEKI